MGNVGPAHPDENGFTYGLLYACELDLPRTAEKRGRRADDLSGFTTLHQRTVFPAVERGVTSR